MKIFLALKQAEFALKLLAAAGFNTFDTALEKGNVDALKDHITAAKTIEKIVEKAVEPTQEQLRDLLTAELRSEITAAGFKLEAGQDPFAALKSGLAAHNTLSGKLSSLEKQVATMTAQLAAVRAAKIEFAADANAEAITKAVNSRINKVAGEELAKRGLKEFAEQQVSDDPTQTAAKIDPKLTGLDRVRAAMELDAAKKK